MLNHIHHLAAVLFATLLAAVFVSCNKVGPEAITVSFSPASLYEELGCLEPMTARISSEGGFVITDSLLVYNQGGTLVTKYGAESRSFEKKELVLKDVPEGTYTFVLWQTAYRGTDDVKAWKIGDEESLSTVRLTTDGPSFAFAWAVGVASASVTVGDGPAKVEMTPKSIGSIIDVTVDNIPEDKGYIRVSMVGGGHVKGLYLDPARQEDKWISDAGVMGVLFRLKMGKTSSSPWCRGRI